MPKSLEDTVVPKKNMPVILDVRSGKTLDSILDEHFHGENGLDLYNEDEHENDY